MRIVVVRHGQAEPKKGWSGPDADRPLVARGRRQAARLGKLIGRRRPDRVVSSPALRCRQTVEPFARDWGLKVEVSDALAPEAGPAAVELCRDLIADGAGAPPSFTVVLCTHREVLVDLLPALVEQFGGQLGHRPPGAKGGAWIVRLEGGRVEKIDYRGPTA
jgi:8-oxo-dGTP diphosphatase